MANIFNGATLYSPSQIGSILRISRERACQEEQRTKKYVAEQLGITVQRLTNIEAGFSQPPFELATDWCRVVGDYTALSQIKHIYKMGLPPTDPRLLESVPNQLNNLVAQAEGAIEAAKKLSKISMNMRPGDMFNEVQNYEVVKLAEEILDMQQAAEATLISLCNNWGINFDDVVKNWTQEAIADRVIIPSVSQYENIRKEQFFANRMRNF
ncbi:helix-turn-helix domain-containing protein [Bacillus massiliigorillae]|uniref:helix-turn-helix domain-containing protein n=1 Tax=Bacillus massiliigorillae TaxID=1243664 RepID=UPI00039A7444|nr:helix-turn-helix transcriptional regulator [Bacillus massiliigorillae]